MSLIILLAAATLIQKTNRACSLVVVLLLADSSMMSSHESSNRHDVYFRRDVVVSRLRYFRLYAVHRHVMDTGNTSLLTPEESNRPSPSSPYIVRF